MDQCSDTMSLRDEERRDGDRGEIARAPAQGRGRQTQVSKTENDRTLFTRVCPDPLIGSGTVAYTCGHLMRLTRVSLLQ